MTERPPAKRPRWSPGKVRALAWVTGSATFLAGFGILGAAPKPAAGGEVSARRKPVRQKVIVRHIVRRVIVVDPPVQVPVYYSGSGSSYAGSYGSGSSGYSGSSGSGGSGGGGVSAPPPPPPPPPVSTGGSGGG
jgi:uncharacterized membrane protein YgcG